jgi:hypothetical protein
MTERTDQSTFDINRLYDPTTDAVVAELAAAEPVETEAGTYELLHADTPETMIGTEQVPAVILHRGAIIEGVREEVSRAA